MQEKLEIENVIIGTVHSVSKIDNKVSFYSHSRLNYKIPQRNHK